MIMKQVLLECGILARCSKQQTIAYDNDISTFSGVGSPKGTEGFAADLISDGGA